MIYLDTSALIKRFVNEKGSLLVRSLVQRDRAVATAKIAYAEIFAGLTRKLRERNLSKAEYTLAAASLTAIGTPRFESSWETIS